MRYETTFKGRNRVYWYPYHIVVPLVYVPDRRDIVVLNIEKHGDDVKTLLNWLGRIYKFADGLEEYGGADVGKILDFRDKYLKDHEDDIIEFAKKTSGYDISQNS